MTNTETPKICSFTLEKNKKNHTGLKLHEGDGRTMPLTNVNLYNFIVK